MDDQSEEFPLRLRLEYSGPHPLGQDEDGPRQYWCTYCPRVLMLLHHEIRVCQNPDCLRKAIADRKERIFELELAIPEVHRNLLSERQVVLAEIERLEKAASSPLGLAQYSSLIKSLDANLGFYGKNKIIDQILRLEQQIRDLSQRIERPTFSSAFRKELWLRDKAVCYLCNLQIESCEGEFMHIDHVIPRIRGGSDDPHNLKIAHAVCNLKKGASELSARRIKAIFDQRNHEAAGGDSLLF